MKNILVALCVSTFLFVVPASAGAAGLVPCGGATEAPCTTCDVVVLTNNVVAWLVMILGTIAAILIVVAGARLVTSGGNMSAKEQAKSSMTNLIIGYLIVLSAWLVLDYGLKALLIQDGTNNFGVWNEVSCIAAVETEYVPFEQQEVVYIPLESLPGWVPAVSTPGGGAGMGGSGAAPGTSNAACTRLSGPPPQAFDCTQQIAQCRNQLGGTPTVNSTGGTVICTPRQVISGGGGGGGSCTVTTNTANACHPSKLTCFPDKNLASKICNVESGGGNTQIMSGTDLCRDGRSFSVGLWQINILANRNLIPGCNSNFFTSDNGGRSEGSCAKYVYNSKEEKYCQFRSCQITNVAVYNQCVANAKIPANNIKAACSLVRTQGVQNAWATSYNRCK